MNGLQEEFLQKAEREAAALMRKEPTDDALPDDVLKHYEDFFQYVRCVAPFVQFFRVNDLAERALTALNAKDADSLRVCASNTQEIADILEKAAVLGHEPAAPDALQIAAPDLQNLSNRERLPEKLLQMAQLLSDKEKKMARRQADLDERQIRAEKMMQAVSLRQNALDAMEAKLADVDRLQAEKSRRLDLRDKETREKSVIAAEKSDAAAQMEKDLRERLTAFEAQNSEQKREKDFLNRRQEQLHSLSEELESMQTALEERGRQVQAAKDENARAEAENRKMRDELSSRDVQMRALEKSLTKKIDETDVLQKVLREKIDDTEKRMAQNDEQCRAALNQAKETRAVFEELQSKYAQKMQKNADLYERLKIQTLKNGELNGIIESLKKDCNHLKKHIEDMQFQNSQDDLANQEARRAGDEWRKKAACLDALSPSLTRFAQDAVTLVTARRAMEASMPDAALLQGLESLQKNLENILLTLYLKPVSQLRKSLEACAFDLYKTTKRAVNLDVRIADNAFADEACCKNIADILGRCLENAIKYATLFNNGSQAALVFKVDITADWNEIFVSVSDNGTGVSIEALRAVVQDAVAGLDVSQLSDEDVLQYLLCDKIFAHSLPRGLVRVQNLLQKLNGKIALSSSLKSGFGIRFSLPSTLMYAQALTFSRAGMTFALPLNCVIESKPVLPYEIAQTANGQKMLSWRSIDLPFVDLADYSEHEESDEPADVYAVVVQTGMCRFALLADQILTTQKMMAISDNDAAVKNPVFPKKAFLENAATALMLDFHALTHLLQLMPVAVHSPKSARPAPEVKKRSFLVYKASPEDCQAISVDYVECVEGFASFKVSRDGETPKIKYHDVLLELRDSATDKNFFYARSLLILNMNQHRFALAIQEILDICEVASDEISNGEIAYQGRAVKIVSSDAF